MTNLVSMIKLRVMHVTGKATSRTGGALRDVFTSPFNKFCNVDSIVLGQAAGVEHVSFYSRTELLISPYNEP